MKKMYITATTSIIIVGIFVLYMYINFKRSSEGFDESLDMKRPFLHIYDNNGKKTNVVFITHPFSREGLFEEYSNAIKKGYYFLGISSYIDFPGLLDSKNKISNPHDVMHNPNHMAWKYDYFSLVKGWCHCFREPDRYIPNNMPKLLLSESDFVNTQNLDLHKNMKKEYDFIYICLKDNDKCENGWQSHNRNWDLAQKCLEVMCNKFHLRGLLIGRINCKMPDGCHNLMETTDFLDYPNFIKQYDRARFIFCPNEMDASPRVLAEGLLRNLPALVNYNILGGWKYISEETGEFFSNMADFEKQLSILLGNFGNYKPRESFMKNFGKEYQGKELLEFVKNIIPKNKLNFIPEDIKYLYPGV